MCSVIPQTRRFVRACVCLLAYAPLGLTQQAAHRTRAERFLQGRATPVHQIPNTPHTRINGLTANWTPIGPAQIASLSYGLVTGRVTSVAIDSSDHTGNTVYLGTTGGGVWKSTNAAGPAASVTFLPLTDTLPVFSSNAGTSAVASLSIGAVSVQPSAGLGAAILAGTGDPNDATDSYYGSGILRSADGGNTWTLAQGSRDGVAGNHTFAGLGTAAFAWSTTTPNLVVAAFSHSAEGILVNAPDANNSVMGLYSSTDAGLTWKMATLQDGAQIVQTPLPSGANAGGNAATAVVWNPIRQKFYAAVRFHGVYESTDGATWTRLAVQPGTGLSLTACPTNPGGIGSPTCPFFRAALAVQPATGDLFALAVDRANQDQGLWQDLCNLTGTTCANTNVSLTTKITSTSLENGSGSTVIPQADYNLALTATPLDPITTLLFAGTEDLYRCAFANGNSATCSLRNTTNTLNGCSAPASVAPSQHAIAAQADLLYLGNDGGLYRSTDGVAQTGPACSSTDASHFQNLNAGLGSLAETIGLAAHPTDPATLLIGVGANGTAFSSSTGPWQQLSAGEGGAVAIDQNTPAKLYISTGPGISISFCPNGAICTPTISAAQVSNDASLIDAPWLLDSAAPGNLIAGTCRAWRGPASGSGWTTSSQLSAPFDGTAATTCTAANTLIRSLAAGGPTSPSTTPANAGSTVLYAGAAGALDGGGSLAGHVFATYSAGTAGSTTVWADLAGSNVTNDVSSANLFNPGSFDVSSLVADPHDSIGKTVYATIMGFAGNGFNAPHVYRSVDGGAHWVNISSNLPNAPANALAIDPNDANTVYVALDTGVYVATQITTCATANCWSVFGAGLPNAPAVALIAEAAIPTGDGRFGVLRVGTYGRGVWSIPLFTAAAPANPALSLAPTSLTFATQAIGSASPTQTVTATNTGNTQITVSSVAIAPAPIPTVNGTTDFTATGTCPGTTLAPGGTCTVQVDFLPIATGSRTSLLTVYANIPGGQATVALTGSATTAAAIVVNPIAATFATTNVGSTSAVLNVTVSNTGGLPVALQSIALTGSQSSDFRITANTCGPSLPSQTGCTVSLVFQPTTPGARTATLTVTSDAGTQTTALTGIATAPATDTLTPLTLTFAPEILNTPSTGQDVTLTNAGDVPLTLIAATIAQGDFTAVNHCGNSLNGHSACTISIAYLPKSVGPTTGVLTVADQYRTQTVALSGSGLAPAGVSLSPFAGIAFPVTAVGVVSDSQPVILTNNGGVPLTIASLTLAGTGFQVVAGSNTCGSTLAPASACTLSLAFVPTASGPQTGSLTFTDSAANSPQALRLTGTGVDFTLNASGPTTVTVASGASAVFPFLLASATGTPGTATFTCQGAPTNATCTVVPPSPNLGGTTSVIVTIATGVSTTHGQLTLKRTLWLAVFLPLLGLRRRWRRATLTLTCLTLLGCGAGRLIPGSGTGGGGGGGGSTPTPSGSYSIAISATSAGLTRTVNVTLIVQ